MKKGTETWVNIDKISSVCVFDKSRDIEYSWRNEKRFLGRITQKKGWYLWSWRSFEYMGTELPGNRLFIDGKLYRKPNVIIYYNNKAGEFFEFNTYNDAIEWANKNFSETKLIRLVD